MLKTLVRGDMRRSLMATITLTILIALAAMLVVVGAGLITGTFKAINNAWEKASPPDVIQMHTGEIDEQALKEWISTRPEVEDYEFQRTLPLLGSQVWFAGESQAESVLEPMMVTAPKNFDLLIDDSGASANPGPGEISMPVHYRKIGAIELGDTVRIVAGGVEKELVVTSFFRDMQMNPSMVTSKRIVLNESDYQEFNVAGLEPEYLLEFLLRPGERNKAFIDAYAQAGMPAQGVAINASVLKLMNGLSTLIVAVLAIIISLVLVGLAALALRFAFLTAMQSDMQSIGTLRAIGIAAKDIKVLYLSKYAVIAVIGTILGALLAIPVISITQEPAVVYLGKAPIGVLDILVPVIAACLVPLLITGFCWRLLRRIDSLATVEVLAGRTTNATQKKPSRRLLLHRSRRLSPDTFLGLKSAFRRRNLLLVGIIAASSFLLIFPTAVGSTFGSPDFSTYLGVGRADVRIDVRDGAEDFDQLAAAIASDPDVEKQVELVTSRFEVTRSDGQGEAAYVVIERGDHTAFPLQYDQGQPPQTDEEIALSVNQAKSMEAAVGDTVNISDGQQTRQLTVSGIYQDITNGGTTAKAVFDTDAAPLWQVIYIKFNPGVDQTAKIEAWKAEFSGAKITDVANYTTQTFGATTAQINIAAVLSGGVGVALAAIVTMLFLVLLVAEDKASLGAQKLLGTTVRMISKQYLIQFLTLGLAGVIVGAILVATLGNLIFRMALGILGAPGVELLFDPILAWGVQPVLLLAVVVAACALTVPKAARSAALLD